jgi:hypothetical protein
MEVVHFEETDIDGRIILKWVLRKTRWEGVHFTSLARVMTQWHAVMYLDIP